LVLNTYKSVFRCVIIELAFGITASHLLFPVILKILFYFLSKGTLLNSFGHATKKIIVNIVKYAAYSPIVNANCFCSLYVNVRNVNPNFQTMNSFSCSIR